jgi:hypothetical protein
MAHLGRGLLMAAFVSGLVLGAPELVRASTGPYTKPFFDPSISPSQPYGCTTNDVEWYVPNCDGKNDGVNYKHVGIDYSGSFDVASSRAGTVVRVVNRYADGNHSTREGNFVVIDHHDGQYSQYWHLKKDSILVDTTTDKRYVSAGQKIAVSDNTGTSTGNHLHYQLTTANDRTKEGPNYSLNPNNYWTTGGSGRVPWLQSFVSQTSGTAVLGSADVCYGDTVTWWVKYKNVGGRTWSYADDTDGRGRIILYSTDSGGDTPVASQFHAADWEASDRPGRFDQSSVAPDGTATFTFGLKGNGTQGQYYTNYFNLDASALHWFTYDSANKFRIEIFIVPHQACG